MSLGKRCLFIGLVIAAILTLTRSSHAEDVVASPLCNGAMAVIFMVESSDAPSFGFDGKYHLTERLALRAGIGSYSGTNDPSYSYYRRRNGVTWFLSAQHYYRAQERTKLFATAGIFGYYIHESSRSSQIQKWGVGPIVSGGIEWALAEKFSIVGECGMRWTATFSKWESVESGEMSVKKWKSNYFTIDMSRMGLMFYL